MKRILSIFLLLACVAFGQAPQQLFSVKVPQVFTYSTGKPQYQDVFVNPTGANGIWGFGTNSVPIFWPLGTNLSVTNGTLNAAGGGGGTPGGSNTQLQYNNSSSFGGITGATSNGTFVVLTSPTITTKISPTTDDGAPLGDTTHNFSDLFLATGGVINFANSNWVATHTSGILTVGTGDLRVTTAGTNAASVVTVGGTQTLTGKSIAASEINSGTLAVAQGGTNLASGTSGGILGYTASGTLASSSLLTSTAIIVGGGAGVTPSTPSATTTLDGSGNISTPGSITTGAGTGAAGYVGLGQGTAPSTGTTNIKIAAPTSVTSYIRLVEGAANSSGFYFGTVSGSTVTDTKVGTTGSGNVVLATSATLVTPALGTPTALVLTNATALPAAQVSSGALANGMTATTQSVGSADTKLATDAYADTAALATHLGTFASPNTAAGAITWTSPVYNIYTSAGSTRTYTLPAASTYANRAFILNVAVGTGHVNVQPASGAALVLAGALLTADHYAQAATSAPGNYICFTSDGTNWTSLGSSGTWADASSP